MLCAVLLAVLRRQPSLTWLGSALLIGVFESSALEDSTVTLSDILLIVCAVPGAYFCINRSVRTAYGAGPSPRWFIPVFMALIGCSLALVLTRTGEPIVQTLFFQLAGVLALLDMVVCAIVLRRQNNPLDLALLTTLVALTVVFVLRIPVFPLLLNQTLPFGSITRDTLQAGLILVYAVLIPASVFLIVARVVSDVLEAHRHGAERDFMTSLPNRRGFEQFAQDNCAEGGALILCDIDHFKTINDRFGHPAGDAVIRAVARLLPGRGYAARIGGEEFAIWLPGLTMRAAAQHAERLRMACESLRVEKLGVYKVTASFGVTSFAPYTPLEEIIARADNALYSAKHSGRNCVALQARESEIPAPTPQPGQAAIAAA